MARRKESIVDEIFDLLVMVPVWVGPLLAAVVFAVFRWVVPPVLNATDGDIKVGQTLGGILSQVAPLFAGGVLLIWVGAEFKKWQRRRRLDQQTGIESVRELKWSQFEELVAEAYRRRGYTAQVVGSPAGDDGIDIVLDRRGERVLVQCKHWKAQSVGVTKVRELAGVVSAERAHRGILVTSGAFTPDAAAFAAKSSIELVEGSALAAMIAEVRRTPRAATQPSSGGQHQDGHAGPEVARVAAPEAPPCPKCGRAMTLRTARQGARAGSQFWGCPSYPQCRGTREL